jgi:hypothetical protein
MEPTKVQLLKVRTFAIKRTLEKASERSKSGHITKPVAAQFNEIVAEIGTQFPSVQNALPKKIEATTDFAMMGLADVSYLDLEMFCEQVLGILELLDSGQ